ncbi:MAG TPA: SGNH/GDSL hydrolase family protein [Micromonosporaceae bacterium]
MLALATPAHAAGVYYVALGDSYSSGVGAGNYTSESGSCDRSYNAYPALWAAAHAPAYYRSVACSGAKTSDVINSQVSALSSSTTLVSITIGGNDAGFSNIMTTCALYGDPDCIDAVNQAEAWAQANLGPLLDQTYNAIRAHAPYAKVVVLDYPVFYQLNTFCVGLSDADHQKIDEGINLIDGITQQAVSRHSGFVFADVRNIFVGHQLCSGDKWLHALNWLDISESYHPTADGQKYGYLPVFSNYA